MKSRRPQPEWEWQYFCLIDARGDAESERVDLPGNMRVGPVSKVLGSKWQQLPHWTAQPWLLARMPVDGLAVLHVGKSKVGHSPGRIESVKSDFETILSTLRLLKRGNIKISIIGGWDSRNTMAIKVGNARRECCVMGYAAESKQHECCRRFGGFAAPYGPPLEEPWYEFNSNTLAETKNGFPIVQRARASYPQIDRALRFLDDTYEYDRDPEFTTGREFDGPKVRCDPIDKLLHTWAGLECILTTEGGESMGKRHIERASVMFPRSAEVLWDSWRTRNRIIHGDPATVFRIDEIAEDSRELLRRLLNRVIGRPAEWLSMLRK